MHRFVPLAAGDHLVEHGGGHRALAGQRHGHRGAARGEDRDGVGVVPEAGGTEVRFAGRVTKVADGVATVSVEATCAEVKVLGSVTAEVDLG